MTDGESDGTLIPMTVDCRVPRNTQSINICTKESGLGGCQPFPHPTPHTALLVSSLRSCPLSASSRMHYGIFVLLLLIISNMLKKNP